MPLITQNPNKQAGLVKASPSADLPQPIVTQKISAPAYKGVAVDLRWVNRADLLTHVEGSSWTVDYYSQVLNADSPLSGQQLSVDGAYQQYQKICGMELKVQTPLTTSQDPDTKGMGLEGTSIVYPFMIPNEGDMFVADIGEGKKGVFRLTMTTKKSIFEQACYEIEYSLDTDQPDKIADLDDKTVRTVFFHKDFMTQGKDPLLVTSEHDTWLRMREVYEVLVQQYFQRFFSDEYKTLLVPQQTQTTYDPFIVDFLLKQFDTQDSQEIRFVKELHLGGDPAMECHNFWTALAARNPAYLRTAFMQAGVVTTRVFNAAPLVNSIRYTGIARSVYPTDAQLVINNHMQNAGCPVSVTEMDKGAPPVGGLYKMVEAVNIATVSTTEGTIKPVLTDSYYVLSEDFYKKRVGMSTFEDVVWQYLERKAIDTQALAATADLWPTWGHLEQFYYIPILMQMLRSVLRGE